MRRVDQGAVVVVANAVVAIAVVVVANARTVVVVVAVAVVARPDAKEGAAAVGRER
jgi:hypothetical protein